MMSAEFGISARTILRCGGALVLTLAATLNASGQAAPADNPVAAPASADDAAPTPTDNIRFGYVVHESLTLGGHLVTQYGSRAMYDTLVNLQSGPRILDGSLELRAVDPKRALLFDHLSTTSFGYGGDPNSFTLLSMTKGKLYDFRGSFRRDRQYFDDNLLANPLIPPTSTPFLPLLDSTHLYNTVRRMTDLNVTVLPLAKVTTRFGYNHTIIEGPSTSTVHERSEALLTQFFRNGTDTFNAGLDWKPLKLSSLSFDQFIVLYKGDTNWQLTGLNYLLSNGTPVSGGIDISSAWNAPCAAPFTATGAYNPTCNGYLGYSRVAPLRTLFPTEQLRFQSASLPKFTMNGRLIYSATTSDMNNYAEFFNGLSSGVRQSLTTGTSQVRRVDVNGDASVAWQLTRTITATDVYDFSDFRMPGTNDFNVTSYAGTSMLTPPGAATTVDTPDSQFINQKTKTNTFVLSWDATSRSEFSLGYRYRSRIITDAGGDFIPIHSHWGLFGAALRPTPQWRLNFNMEAMYADMSFTRISPRQMQHYIARTTYKPAQWMTLTGTMNLLESRDNVQTVNHLDHARDYSAGATIARYEHWSLDMFYAYDDVFSTTIECYASSAPLSTATTAPDVCVAAGTPFASTAFYDAPTQTGTITLTLEPLKRVHFNGGYRATSVDGNVDRINARQVPGTLQSQFQTPFAHLAFDLAPNWQWVGDYNYYGYGENGAVGPTAPRAFHGNVYTLAVHYAF